MTANRTTNNPELQQFAQQLALWTELVIENGRTPFRRVDLYPEIYSAQEPLQPPLVFWINRQSYMAGGILLLPEKDLENDLELGRRCCEALGLKHFVTWENERVRIWQVDNKDISVHQEFSLEFTGHPDSFRYLLNDLLEALKLLAVIGMVPARNLSADYLSNLYLTTLDLALPPLISCYRSQRAENAAAPREDVDRLATEANRLVLLQLLTLLWHNLLPASILPEKLGQAIDLCLPKLVDPLQQHFSRKVAEVNPELPHESAVCFHHLLLRLQQLSWDTPAGRAITSIQQLIATWYPSAQADTIPADVYLYPATLNVNPKAQLLLSDSPALLASAALLENLTGTVYKQLLFGNGFNLQLPCKSGLRVYSRLTNAEIPSRDERQQYTAFLRISWPNRRFRISGHQPLWYWEFIHILGLCKGQKKLRFTLPAETFQAPSDDPVWPLLFEHFSLHQLEVLTDGTLTIELSAGQQAGIQVNIQGLNGTRTFVACDSVGRFRSQILLATSLPDSIYQLLEQQFIWPEAEEPDPKVQSGLQLYAQTSLGQSIQRCLAEAGTPGPLTAHSDCPHPETALLQELNRIHQANSAADLDQLLAKLLNHSDLAEVVMTESVINQRDHSRAYDRGLKQEIIDLIQTEGVPTFPDQYLYFLDNPAIQSYEITPPLTLKRELLGQIEFEDAAGHVISVYGNELAEALIICAEIGKSEIELPADRQQIQYILQQYREELIQLHKYLSSLCHSRLKSSKAAQKLTKKIWKSFPLPALQWLND